MILNNKSKILSILFAITTFFIAFEYFAKKEADKLAALNEQEKLFILKQIEDFSFNEIRLEEIDSLDKLKVYSLAAGIKEMQKHKVIIAGIARDNLTDLPITLKHLYELVKLFADYRVIIFENDSKDGTKTALNIWSKKDPKVRIISEDFNNKKRPNHKFMADVRNKYISSLKDSEYEDFNLVMLIDLDMAYGFDIRGIQDSFSRFEKWDVVCSNGIKNQAGQMYDVFAFRNEEFPFSPKKWHGICEKKEMPHFNKCKIGEEKFSKGSFYDMFAFRSGWQEESRLFWLRILPQMQKIYSIGEDLVPVFSCFGGLAFYKKNFIQNCIYDSIEDDCEHVYFHQCLRKNNAKIFMNPSQIIRYSHYK